MRKRVIAIIFVMSIMLMACGEKGTTANEDEHTESSQSGKVLEIFTTIYPLEDFANKIGGTYVHVTNLVPVGADAHTYEPTPREMIKVAEGDMFIYNGAGLEGFADALIETLKGENVAIVNASNNINLIDFENNEGQLEESHDHRAEVSHGHESHDHRAEESHVHEGHDHKAEEGHDHDGHDHAGEESHHHEGHHHDKDPHVWLDPILAISMAESIKDELNTLMPEQEETFTANFEHLKAELEDIDAEFRAMVDEASNHTFLVSHAGYGYWEERYGLRQMPIAGLSPTNEPSQRQLQRMIEFANESGVKYVLLEQNISTKVADVVKNAIGGEALYLHNLEAITEQDLGEDYSSLMRKNIEVLKIALQ